jgi:alpha-N-arabinofuranosidase
LDVAAAWTKDRSALTVAIVNPTEDWQFLLLKLQGATWTGRGQKWCITGPNRWAHNAPGKPRQVDIHTEAVTMPGDRLQAAPLSVILYELPVQ